MSEDATTASHIPQHQWQTAKDLSAGAIVKPASDNTNAKQAPLSTRCRLLELPAELREQIWTYAVSEWVLDDSAGGVDGRGRMMCYRQPVRIDRFNHHPPPAITATCSQIRAETLQMYYELNTFECCRPRFRRKIWTRSSLVDWLTFLGPVKRTWLRSIILLCKPNDVCDADVEATLALVNLRVPEGIIRQKLQVTDLERRFEQLGLPRHFGRKRSRR